MVANGLRRDHAVLDVGRAGTCPRRRRARARASSASGRWCRTRRSRRAPRSRRRTRAARGSSIIVPIEDRRASRLGALELLGHDLLDELAHAAQLLGEADERDHDLRPRGSPPRAARPRARRARSRAPASRRSPGAAAPRRQPRVPSIGFCSCSALTRAEQPLGVAQRPRLAAGAQALDRERRVDRDGRNSCSGGSSSRIVTGRPVHGARRSPRSRACCIGRMRSRAPHSRRPRRRRGSSRARPAGAPRP